MVEAEFRIVGGTTLPLDYRYVLHSAIKQGLGGVSGFALGDIRGRDIGQGDMLIQSESIIIRPHQFDDNLEFVHVMNEVACKRFKVGRHIVELGSPTFRDLVPSQVLESDFVLFKSNKDTRGSRGNDFAASLGKHVGAMCGVDVGIEIGKRVKANVRKITMYGSNVRLTNLSPEQSLVVQCRGIGALRSVGFGVFQDPSGSF